MGALVVVVHGPPGAGKSTLAAALGRELALPVFDRDDFKDATFEVLGWSDRDWSARVGNLSWRLLSLCVDRLVRAGQSLVVETNFRPGTAAVAELDHLLAETGAGAVQVHCTAAPGVLWSRFDRRRDDGGRHPGHVGFDERDAFLADLVARPHGPLGLPGPLVEVDTTDSWPDPASLAARIRDLLGA